MTKDAPVTCKPGEHADRRSRTAIPDHAFDRAAAIFRAAGDEARLRLLVRLAEGEWCVSELAEAAGVGLSTVSQQLRLLRAEHLVRRRRAGKHVFYALADEHVADLIRSALDHAIEERSLSHRSNGKRKEISWATPSTTSTRTNTGRVAVTRV